MRLSKLVEAASMFLVTASLTWNLSSWGAGILERTSAEPWLILSLFNLLRLNVWEKKKSPYSSVKNLETLPVTNIFVQTTSGSTIHTRVLYWKVMNRAVHVWCLCVLLPLPWNRPYRYRKQWIGVAYQRNGCDRHRANRHGSPHHGSQV